MEQTAAVAIDNPIVAERSQGYYNLLSYIVSNAIAGEIMAIENYSEMVQLMPTVAEKIEIDVAGKYRVCVGSNFDRQALRRVLDVLERR